MQYMIKTSSQAVHDNLFDTSNVLRGTWSMYIIYNVCCQGGDAIRIILLRPGPPIEPEKVVFLPLSLEVMGLIFIKYGYFAFK